MNSILIIGASNAGKSSTMEAVCKKLKPTKVYRLISDQNDFSNSVLKEAKVEDIFNNTFIIEVEGKFILVCAGAPTEQNIRITVLIEICIRIKIEISFLLVSMRSFEKREDFDTPNELDNYSNRLLSERIYRIQNEDYEQTTEWRNRINKIVKTLLENL